MANSLNAQIIAGALGLGLIGAATVAAHAAAPEVTWTGTNPYVIVMDQKVKNSEVAVDYAYLPTNGYVVAYSADKDGNIGKPIGHAEVKAGDHRNVKIKLSEVPAQGTSIWVSLYADLDQKPGFDANSDAPFWADSLPLANRFLVQ